MAGFASIGLVRPKDVRNVGGVLRAAQCYGAAMIAIQGDRTRFTSELDVGKAYKHIPVVRGDDLLELCPAGAVPVAVDLVDEATDLRHFKHPRTAFYIFGPEDGTLSKTICERCVHVVMIPTFRCMNLAATVNVILYDRLTKRG